MQGTNSQLWPAHKRLRVLIADDNHDAADSLAFLVRIWGHDARVAYDGEAALALAAAFRPQVALLDIGMPKLDGYQLCRRFRQDKDLAATVLVALTAYSDEQTRGSACAAGFDHHLVKPAEPARIQMLLNQARGPDADEDGTEESPARVREIDFPTATRRPAPVLTRLCAHLMALRAPAGKHEGGRVWGQ